MKSVALNASKREISNSKSPLNQLRNKGRIPAVLYGGKENVHFDVDEVAFEKLINTREVYFIDLDIDGDTRKAVIRDVQFHPVSDKPLHVDFMEVFEDKPVTMSVPVSYSGVSIGVLNGGKKSDKLRKLVLKALPKDMPEEVNLDISKLRIGQSIKVQDVDLPNVEKLDTPNAVIVAVKTSRVAVADTGEEEAEGESAEGESAEEAPATE